MIKKILLGITALSLLSILVVANKNFYNPELPAGPRLYKELTYVEVKAKGQNTGGSRVAGERYRIELTVVFEVASDKVVDIFYKNTGKHTTGGNYEKFWAGKKTSSTIRPNHVTGYPELITTFIGKTAKELSQTSTSVTNNGANMVDAVSGATLTTSNFTSSVKIASEEYLKGNAAKSAWKL